MPHLAIRASAGTHAITLQTHRVREPTGIYTVGCQPLKPAEHHHLTLGNQEVQPLKSAPKSQSTFAPANYLPHLLITLIPPESRWGHLPSPEDGP